jgi:hypothetical protein
MPRTRTSVERTIHAGGEGHYALGIGFEGTRRSYAQRRTLLTADPLMRPFRFFASLNSAAARISSVNYWRTILSRLHRLVAETAVDAHLLRLVAVHEAAHRDVAFAGAIPEYSPSLQLSGHIEVPPQALRRSPVVLAMTDADVC